jgi:glycosyltransferase involved in cell wall biosynthesis
MTRPGLILVSPLPPTWSGIADYTARLLPHLARHWTITVIVADDDPEPAQIPDGVRVVTASSWATARRMVSAEKMLHCLGNSRHHLHVPELCEAHGGVVLAHDVRMVAFHCLRAAVSPDAHSLSRLIAQRHGPELEREVRAIEDRIPLAESFLEVRRRLEDANALLLGAAVAGADAVVVHSRLAARLAQLDLRGARIPVSVVPFGMPALSASSRDPVINRISSFGMVEPEKQPTLLIEALAVLRQRGRDATLRLVGPLGGGVEGTLRQLTERLGVAEGVSWTDRVSDAAYHDELARAAIAVQLKRTVNGETSAAVADCLAFGIPTVVSAIGAQRELPESAVTRVPDGVMPHELATKIEAVLADPAEAARLSRGGQEHAATFSAEVAAAALTEVLRAAPMVKGLG